MKKQKPDCTWDFVNAGQEALRLILEPEGAEFMLPPGKSIQIHFLGVKKPIAIKYAQDRESRPVLAFWPDKGNYELFFKGKRVGIWCKTLKRVTRRFTNRCRETLSWIEIFRLNLWPRSR